MSTHVYSSRGRTRQPKNLALPIHGTIALAKLNGNVGIVAADTDLNETIDDATVAENGYDTQNQDYLHICMAQATAATRTVSIYAYNRCFGTWGRLKIPVSNATTLDGMYVNADIISVASKTTQFVIPIHGIDRIAFVGGTTGGLTLYAAGSTI
jgi:hypothetical protein